MSNNYFKFKQFTVFQDRTAMKVGTDGVLLGTLARVPENAKFALDIGTGTGLVSLILAQRFPSIRINAIDIDKDAAKQAEENFFNSPFSSQLTSQHIDINYYNPEYQFDAIVCNPPYYSNSLINPNPKRAIARHSLSLSYTELTNSVVRLLSKDGLFTVIVPADSFTQLENELKTNGLYALNTIFIKPSPNKNPIRNVATFSRKKVESKILTITIESTQSQYSSEFQSLINDFYLDKK